MLAVKVFAEDVAEQIKAYLPPEYQEARYLVREQNKTNSVLQVGIQVDIPGQSVSPIIYMEPFYDEVQRGESLDEIMCDIAGSIQQAVESPALGKSIQMDDFETLKDYLAVMVVNTAENRRLLESVPHKEVADLSLVCYVDLPVGQKGCNATFKVTEQMIELWNLSKDEVFQIASDNSKPANEPVLQDLEDVMLQIIRDDESPKNLLHGNKESCEMQGMMFILSNAKRNYGAAMMCESQVMDKISQLFPEGFYILPSSLHEVLIIPDRGEISPRELGQMVREVNQKEVDKMDQLSD